MTENNKIFKTNEISIEISPVKNTVDSQRAQYYSYDENSGLQRIRILKDGQPLGLPEGSEIRLSAVKLSGTKQMMVYTPEIEDRVNGIVTFVIPKEFLGYSGQIRCTLYIDFSSDQTLHAGYFYINMGISDIDANLPEFSDSYWQRWADFESEATAKMKELEASLDGEAQRLNEHANQKITEYDQTLQKTNQDIAALSQGFNELRNGMKLSEAWAWSKDGTDRFTRRYPGENLYTKANLTRLIFTEGSYNGNSSNYTGAIIPVTAGKTYTVASHDRQTHDRFRLFFTLEKPAPYMPNTVINSTNGTEPMTWTATEDGYLGIHLAQSATGVPENVRLKVEIGDTATIYTPAPSGDPINAYPQYRGLSAIPSDLPEDYVWEESAERIKQLAQQETDKLKGEVADIQNWIAQQGGTA